MIARFPAWWRWPCYKGGGSLAVSFHDRLHDRVFKLGPHFTDGRLDHHDRHYLLLGVDPEVCAIGAAPAEAAIRDAMISDDGVLHYADAQAIALARCAPGKGVGDVHGAHQLH